ncbi:Gfo/Idh/MocA family oxidoreductase [uncultured Vagococcus sp.]|uniref:Gfo/Idh/MocA family protein n=1 Tax=uncultured Vagococcus sp. TaxID=189676 RepID=UPI0028D54264|nr:Gfo/Idh/MocA family oxidoreductase [uncultured Vagococcus sp.]
MKVGILGCAHMQAKSYAYQLKVLGVPLVGVFDHNTERGQDFAKGFDIPFFANLNEILLTDMDTVLICSENSYHYDYTLVSAFHGKHVIVEKPISSSVEEAEKMILVCREHHVKLLIAHPLRYSETIRHLKELMTSGQLGNVLAINGSNRGKRPSGWFLDKELAGGGAIIDHTIHLIDLSRWLFDFDIKSIYARSANNQPSSKIEDSGLIHITFTNNVFMSLDTSWNRPSNYPVWGSATMELITDRGRIFVDGFGRKSEIIYFNQQMTYSHYENHMDYQMLADFQRCIDDDLPVPVSGEAGKYTVEIANLAYQSINEKKIIFLTPQEGTHA